MKATGELKTAFPDRSQTAFARVPGLEEQG